MKDIPILAQEPQAIARHQLNLIAAADVERLIRSQPEIMLSAFIAHSGKPMVTAFLGTTTSIACHPDEGFMRFYLSALVLEQKDFDCAKAFTSWVLARIPAKQLKARPIPDIFESMKGATDRDWVRT